MAVKLTKSIADWAVKVLDQVREDGYSIVDSVLSESFIQVTREAM